MEKNKRLLIIDPDTDWARRLSKSLFQSPLPLGIRDIHIARDGRQGLMYLNRHKPDAIIMEMLLEVYDGLFLLDAIHKLMPEYHPIVYIISAMQLEEQTVICNRIFEIHPQAYIAIKPQKDECVAGNLHWFFENGIEMPAPAMGWKPNVGIMTDEQLMMHIDGFLRLLDHKTHLRRALAAKVLLRILVRERPSSFDLGYLYRKVGDEIGGSYNSAERLLRSFAQAAQENRTSFFEQHFTRSNKANGEFYWTAYRVFCDWLNIPWKSPLRPRMSREPRR